MTPCALCHLDFDIDLSDDDEVQVSHFTLITLHQFDYEVQVSTFTSITRHQFDDEVQVSYFTFITRHQFDDEVQVSLFTLITRHQFDDEVQVSHFTLITHHRFHAANLDLQSLLITTTKEPPKLHPVQFYILAGKKCLPKS